MILGISGTHGAGKGAVVQFLKEKGYIHCSARELLLEELQKKGVANPGRPEISEMANELRSKYGLDHVVKTFVERHDPVTNDIVIESIYAMGEVEAIRQAGGYTIAVDADPEIRYERINSRKSETDNVSKEEFMHMQEQESRATDPTKQDSRTVMEDADFHIENNGDLIELRIQVNAMLEKLNEAEK